MRSAEPTSDERRTALIERLHRMQQELRELATGSVDAVMRLSDVSELLGDVEAHLHASGMMEQQKASEHAAILDAIPSHLALLDETGRIVTVNEAWRRFAWSNGFSGDSFAVGENYIKVCERAGGMASKAAAEVASGLRTVLAGQTPGFTIEYPCHGPGEERWFRMIAEPVNTPVRNGALVIHRDVTALTIADRELTRATDLLRLAGRMAKVGGWSIELDSGNLELSNEVGSIYEMEPGTSISLEEGFSFYAPESRERIMEAFTTCAQDATSYDEELEIVTAKGNRRWVRAIGEAVRDGEGRIGRVQGAFQDIGALKQAEATLRQSDRRFREFADALPQIVWTADANGDVDYVNDFASTYAGLPLHKPPGEKWFKALHPDDVQRSIAAWQEAVRTGARYSNECRIRAADGSYRWHLISAAPIRDVSSTVVKWYGTAIDEHEHLQVEDQNRRLAVRLNTTLESIADGFYMLDRDWRFTFVNAQAERLMRHDRKSLIGQSPWEVFDPATAKALRPEYERAVSEGKATQFDFWHPRLEMWFDVAAYPSEEGLAVYLRDVTQRYLSEKQVRESEARFEAVARATADVVWDWDLKESTVWWSDGYEHLFGYSRNGAELEPESWTSHIHPDDRDRVVSKIYEAIERRDEYWEDQYRFLHRDGSEIDIEDRGYLILDDRGEPVRFVGGMSDITERTRAERQIAEQASLIDAAHDGIIARDMNHRIEFWSRGAEEIYGWTRDEAVGQSIETLLYDDSEPLRQATAALLERGEWQGQLQQRGKDGKPLTVAAHCTLVRDAAGAPKRILSINTDITERLILEEQLRQAQRLEMVGQLTGGVAHDFNNLLTVILGNAELLVEELNHDQRARFLAEMMKTAAERGADLTSRLLAFARRQPLEPRPVELNRMVRSMDGLLRRTLGEQIEIKMVQADGLWQALVDLPQIESALLNLCINARDAMPRGGKLTIETANVRLDADYVALHADVMPGQYVMLAVSDAGTGMTPEVVARAFEPFFTTKGAGKGSGLGLSMVYGFVKQSSGHVKIYSELGYGTTIRLYLPRAPGDAENPITSEREATSEGGSEVILMVEDDDLVREHVAEHLRSLGYGVLTAANGAEALDVLRSDEAIDLLFTDIVMPGGMNGRELADQALSIRPSLPVLFTSGYSENVIVHHGRLDPDVHLLQKPYGRHQLAAKLLQVFGERPRRGTTMAGRLLILDDDDTVGTTIASIAERSGFEARSCMDPTRFFELLDDWDPTHIALDLVMPDSDGIEIMRRLTERGCDAAVIVTSGIGVRVLDAAARAAAGHGLNVVGVLAKPIAPAKLRPLLKADLPLPRNRRSLSAAMAEVTEADLARALKAKEIEAYFQPQIACATRALVGFEALARWRHPEAGLITPDRFIPVAERTDLIDALTVQILEHALDWIAASRPEVALDLSINLSARTLGNIEFADRLAELCAERVVDSKRIVFEVTETSAMADQKASLDLLTRLRIKGFQLAIDDFGLGYSSLVQLARLPFSVLKIDKSFVIEVARSEEARVLVRSIIGLGQNLGLRVIAEGVEDAWSLDFLRDNGCDYAQGYFIGRPMTGTVALAWAATYEPDW